MTHWHYQPVFIVVKDEIVFSVCECHFDADDRLVSWTESPAMIPLGESMDELTTDLIQMLADCYKWEPVSFYDMTVGMRIKRTGANIEGMIAAMNMARSSME